MVCVRYSSKVLKTLILKISPGCWRAVKYSTDCTAPVTLTGIWIQIFAPRLCVSQGGLLIPLTRGQDMHRKHREGLPAHKIFLPKDLTGDALSRFGSGTFTSPPCDKGFCQPRVVLLFHQSSPHSQVVPVSDLFLLCYVSAIASDGANTKRRGFYS